MWIMVPAGDHTTQAINRLIELGDPGDIIVQAGPTYSRIVRRPSPALRSFFEGMARDMTGQLSAEEKHSLRRTYFADVAERVSELIGEELTELWAR